MTPFKGDPSGKKKTNKVTSGFRLPGRTDHNGIDCKGEDIATPRDNKNVRCVTAGTVDAAVTGWNGGRGNTVYVRTAPNIRNLYQHLNSIAVRKGQQLKQGDGIGVEGWTGHCIPSGPGGSHLHFEVQKLINGRWVPIDPTRWLGLPNAKGFYHGNDQVDGDTKPPAPEKYNVKPTTRLHIRKGPGVRYDSVGIAQPGTSYTILETKGNWGRIPVGKSTWICLDYTKRV